MKYILCLICFVLLVCQKALSQPVPGPITPGAFCRGYLIPYLPNAGLNSCSLNLTGVLTPFSSLVITQTNDLTGIGIAHVKVTTAGWDQWFLRFINGSNALIDFTAFPYITVRAKTKWAGVKDVPMNITFIGTPNGSIGKDFTLKGDGKWHNIGIDFNEYKAIGCGEEMHLFFNDTCTMDIDEFRFGSIGDPDTAVQVSMNPIDDYTCDKDAGEQIHYVMGYSNGIDVSKLSISQTNTNPSLIESFTFDPIVPDSVIFMHFTPKAGVVGQTTVRVTLKYNRGDTVVKYKSEWFDINVVSDPKMTIASSINAVVNQPKGILNITNATNSMGGYKNLSLAVSSGNTALITNLTADSVKADGTSKISFVPGLDMCGYDSITATITDMTTGRSRKYKIAVAILKSDNTCDYECTIPVPDASDDTVCSGHSAVLTASGATNYRWYSSASGGSVISSGYSYTTPLLFSGRTYYVANYNGSCESLRKAVNVTVISTSSIQINPIPNNHIDCNDDPIPLTANPSGGLFSGDGVELGFFVPLQAKANHINSIYYTIGDSAKGCQAKDSIHVFVFSCTELDEAGNDVIRIFPNPSDGRISVEIQNQAEEGTIHIIDGMGKIIAADHLPGNAVFTKSYDLSVLPAGVYLLKVNTGDKSHTSKILIK